MKPLGSTRREFIAVTGMATLGFLLSEKAHSQQSTKINNMNNASYIGYVDGKYVLPPLPYAYDALEPLMDEATVRLHHDKHHAAYVAGANAAAEKLQEIADGKLDASATTPNVRNLSFHASGHALHTIFWTNMTPTPKAGPEGPLKEAIIKKFGSVDNMIKVFKAATIGVEGSGWGILGLDPISKTLVICGAEKHQNIEIPGLVPLLVCDVWEHAYYLKHQNNRAAFVEDFMKLVNWDDVEQRYLAAIGK